MTKFLDKEKYWVRATDIKKPGRWSQSPKETFPHEFHCGNSADLRVYENAKKAVGGCEWVFHFGADMGGVGYFFSDADYDASIDNLLIDRNVLRACEELGVKRLFYASSFCAYPIEDQVLVDGKAKRAMVETDLGGGPGEQLYGEEKRIITMFLDKAPFDARAGIFSTIYGPYQEIEDEKRSKFPTAIIKKVWDYKNGKTKDIEMWGDGSQIRTYLFIDDFLKKAYRIMSADKYEGPVNIGSDEQVSCKEMADYVCELAGVKPNYRFDTSKPTGVLAKDTDNTKFKKLYGDVPQTPAREGFKEVYRWLEGI